jgi:pimeloyl-ACP methyl ester carboxylesterase
MKITSKHVFTLILLLSVYVSVALNPEREYSVTPADYGMSYNNLKIKTADNMMLQAWLFNATDKQSRKVIILSHNGDGNMADLIEIASNFLSLGYHVLTYDYRGYGKSDDFEINTKFFIYSQFQKDLEGALDYVIRQYPSMKTIHLYGAGIGAGLSIGVGVNRPEVSMVIADSPYLSFEITERRFLELYNQKVMMPLGFDKTWLEPLFALDRKNAGITGLLLIAGTEDFLYTVADMKELYKLHKSVVKIYEVTGAKHNTTFISNKGNYFAEIKKFLGV